MSREPLYATSAIALAALAFGTAGCGDDTPPERAGEQRAPIVGGTEDNGHDYVVGVGDNRGPWCTGTLISRQTVITASHCALGISRVYFGKFLQDSVVADREVTHPEWTGDVRSPDVALVRLATATDAQGAPLLRRTLDNSATYIGPDFTFVGFGVTDGVTGQGAGIKREVKFPITAIGPTFTADNIPVPEEFIYYEDDSKNTCFGDSGGPTFFINAGVENHAAVTSWGDEFCQIYGVQGRTDQPEIDQWIQDTIDEFEELHPCSNDGLCEESCNDDGEVHDPDCHAEHCGEDGICALACVAPYDPDCPEVYDPCGEDGYCTMGCMPVDPDCPMTTVSSGPAVVSVGVSTSTGSGAGSTGGGDEGPERADPTARSGDLYGRACGCRTAGGGGGLPRALVLLLALGALRRVSRRDE